MEIPIEPIWQAAECARSSARRPIGDLRRASSFLIQYGQICEPLVKGCCVPWFPIRNTAECQYLSFKCRNGRNLQRTMQQQHRTPIPNMQE
jgi:hypothetical protein